MRVTNPDNNEQFIYVGKCKGNQAPKHVTEQGEKKAIKLDGKKATMFDSPKSKDYIYIKVGSDWLWVKNKAVFSMDSFTTQPVTRAASAKPETEAEAATIN